MLNKIPSKPLRPLPIHSSIIARHRQLGAVAIEFALAFPLFFTLFYAIVNYSLVMTFEQSMTNASLNGARAAIAVDRTSFSKDGDYQAKVAELTRNAVAQSLSWVPEPQKTQILGNNNGNVDVSINGANVTVKLTYAYSQAPLLPVLSFPVIGDVPSIPDNLVVTSDAML